MNGSTEAQSALASGWVMLAAAAHRMFPLPLIPLPPAPSSAQFSSRRSHQRHSQRRLVAQLSNAAITACNLQASGASSASHLEYFRQLHSSTLYPLPPPPRFSSAPSGSTPTCIDTTGRRDLPSRADPFDSSSVSKSERAAEFIATPLSPSPLTSRSTADALYSTSTTAAQRRATTHLHQQCASFVNQCRASSESSPTSGAMTQLRQLSSYLHHRVAAPASASTERDARSPYHSPSDQPPPTTAAPLAFHNAESQSLAPASHAHSYSVPAAVVPIVAHRIALPPTLTSVSILSLLPHDLAADYAHPSQLLRDPIAVDILNLTRPLAPPRVSGSRAEYILLLQRMQRVGMIAFTRAPKAVNGLFAVVKDADSERLIIDAQPANRLFADPPHVSLPNPSHLVQIQLRAGSKLHLGKSDLSNFYHQLRLPEAWQPYFCLPPLTLPECKLLGLKCDASLPPLHPMCVTMPMGFSHAVFLAQRAHEHVLYRHAHTAEQQQPNSQLAAPPPALDPLDNLLRMESPLLDRCIHGLYIDDLWLMSPSFEDIDVQYRACLAAYRFAGLPDSVKKREPPLRAPVAIKAIGVCINPSKSTLSIAADDRIRLARATLSILRAEFVTGKQLSQLIGSWTWCMLLRRSTLCVLQHTYRFIAVAQESDFVLWPAVRRELQCLLCFLPLLHTDMASRFCPVAYASDASEFAGGVVSAPLTPAFAAALYPLSSNRRFNLLPLHRLHESPAASEMPPGFMEHVNELIGNLQPRMQPSLWRVLIASRWRAQQHINVLELHAVLLALRHALSSPTSVSARIYMLVDSAVAYYTLWKGRSSSHQLLPVLRQINSHLLVTGASLQPCWIPSKWNPADGPSRLTAFPTAVTAAAERAVAEQIRAADMQLPFDTGTRHQRAASAQ